MKNFTSKMMAKATCAYWNMQQAAKDNAGVKALMVTGTAATCATSVYAAKDNLQQKLGSALKSIYSLIVGLTTGIAVVFIAYNIVRIIVASDPREAAVFKKRIVEIIIAWVGINLLGTLAAWVSGLGDKQLTQTGTGFGV